MDQPKNIKGFPKCIRCKLKLRTPVTLHLLRSEYCMKFMEDNFPTFVRMMRDCQCTGANLGLLEYLIVEFFEYAESYCLSSEVFKSVESDLSTSKIDMCIRDVAKLSLSVSCTTHSRNIGKDFSSDQSDWENVLCTRSSQSGNLIDGCRNGSSRFGYLTEFIDRLNEGNFLEPVPYGSQGKNNNGLETNPEHTTDLQLYATQSPPKFESFNLTEDLLIYPYDPFVAANFSLQVPVEPTLSSPFALSCPPQHVIVENETLDMIKRTNENRFKEPPNKFRNDFEKLLSISRKISALEGILGVLGPKATHLLMKVVSMKHVDLSSVNEVILSDENGMLLETVREKLEGLIKTRTLNSRMQTAAKNVINGITEYLSIEDESVIII